MGIRDAVYSTADALRNRLPDPEPVKNAYSAVANKLLCGAPDLRTPVAGILSSSYNHGRSALSTVGKAVRVERVKESMPDKEGLAEIGWSLTDQALDKYTRIYTVCISQPKWMGFANLWWIEGFWWKEGKEGRGDCSSCTLVAIKECLEIKFPQRHGSTSKDMPQHFTVHQL